MPRSLSAHARTLEKDNDQNDPEAQLGTSQPAAEDHVNADPSNRPEDVSVNATRLLDSSATKNPDPSAAEDNSENLHVSFADGPKALYIPSPREQDRGEPLTFRPRVDTNRHRTNYTRG